MSHETEPKPQFSFVRQLLKVASEALDSSEFVTGVPEDRELAFLALADFDSLDKVALVHETWFKREEREKEKDALLPGEHPGAHISTVLSDGRMLEINIKGGIRDPQSKFELKDRLDAKSLHTDRTIGLGDKSTESSGVNPHLTV